MLARPHAARGFTLIELMIVIVVIGLLAAVAFPSYQDYIRKSRRGDGRVLLQAAQLAQEKYRLNHTTYYPGGAASGTGLSVAEFNGVCIASGTNCVSQSGYYRLTATTTTVGEATSYTLTAIPVTGSPQNADTACNGSAAGSTMTITQSAGTVTYSPDVCWGK
ncbi:MAG: type IV pilin protein [Rhodocyclaceae bacterium]|jgi:type IV pilus assembly protein PilE|nr:type IV pilin protein [Rhodocyclaceae bacterium]